ncbi:MAG: hypothetical protein HRT69_13085 [Flavobacteriaceae bacterium]|nr:hypothetical protein [Flavobacteriaceae bacterium]
MEINDQVKEVLKKHTGLVFDFEKYSLIGELFLPDGDSYEIQIVLYTYPRLFPTVYETGGRIPPKMDRHIYPDSGSCCFTTRAKSQILLKTKVTSLLKFIDEVVIKYFENNSFYELNKHYYGDEYSHGKMGIIEGYKDILKIDDTITTAKAIIQATTNKSLKKHQNCYCGSGRRLRKCTNGKHINNFRKLLLVEKEVLESDLRNFKEAIEMYLERNDKEIK